MECCYREEAFLIQDICPSACCNIKLEDVKKTSIGEKYE